MRSASEVVGAVFRGTAALALVATVGWSMLGHHGGQRKPAAVLPGASLTAKEIGDAEALFASTCASCHGASLEGGVGPSLAQVAQRRSAAKIERIIRFGKGRIKAVAMPGGLVSGDQATLLARWLSRRRS